MIESFVVFSNFNYFRTMPKSKKRKKRQITWVKGFKVPSSKKRRLAIGDNVSLSWCKIEPVDGSEFFAPIPKPIEQDDWLAQYNEPGQTYDEFIEETPWLSFQKIKSYKMQFYKDGHTILEKYPGGKIYLLPLGEFNGDRLINFDHLIEFAEIYIGIPVIALPQIQLLMQEDGKLLIMDNPLAKCKSKRRRKFTLKTRYDSKSKHYQINVDSALKRLRKYIPVDAICTMGLTLSDLYEDEPDLFVAGIADGNAVGVFSFFRYDPTLSFSIGDWNDYEHLDNVSLHDRKTLILERSCKLLVHEINHLLGLDHCIFFECCMNGSGHLEEDFRQPIHLCPVDLHKLQSLVGFNVLERYQKLLKFYRKHDMNEEFEWTKRRIEVMKDQNT